MAGAVSPSSDVSRGEGTDQKLGDRGRTLKTWMCLNHRTHTKTMRQKQDMQRKEASKSRMNNMA